jgi:hypothetical protein
VRKRPKGKDKDEAESPCPHCWAPVPNSALSCDSCKQQIPYCIVSGMHMTFNDWTFCPSCRFPAKHSMFGKYAETNPVCPMCSYRLLPGSLTKVKDPKPQLTAYLQLFAEGEGDKAAKPAAEGGASADGTSAAAPADGAAAGGSGAAAAADKQST